MVKLYDVISNPTPPFNFYFDGSPKNRFILTDRPPARRPVVHDKTLRSAELPTAAAQHSTAGKQASTEQIESSNPSRLFEARNNSGTAKASLRSFPVPSPKTNKRTERTRPMEAAAAAAPNNNGMAMAEADLVAAVAEARRIMEAQMRSRSAAGSNDGIDNMDPAARLQAELLALADGSGSDGNNGGNGSNAVALRGGSGMLSLSGHLQALFGLPNHNVANASQEGAAEAAAAAQEEHRQQLQVQEENIGAGMARQNAGAGDAADDMNLMHNNEAAPPNDADADVGGGGGGGGGGNNNQGQNQGQDQGQGGGGANNDGGNNDDNNAAGGGDGNNNDGGGNAADQGGGNGANQGGEQNNNNNNNAIPNDQDNNEEDGGGNDSDQDDGDDDEEGEEDNDDEDEEGGNNDNHDDDDDEDDDFDVVGGGPPEGILEAGVVGNLTNSDGVRLQLSHDCDMVSTGTYIVGYVHLFIYSCITGTTGIWFLPVGILYSC